VARNSVTELPSNATRLQRVMSDVDAGRADAVEIAIVDLWNPWRCPTELLPFLAWAVSVDVWNPAWSEIEKRREIAASPGIHRRKGTRAATERSLARLGLAFDLTEWWQPYPTARRGTFKVFIEAGDIPTPVTRSEALLRIRTTKPKSRVVDLKVGVSETGPLGIAAATITRSLIVSENYILDGVLEEIGPLGFSAASLTRSIITSEAA
jgi:phage tail P2-like protein